MATGPEALREGEKLFGDTMFPLDYRDSDVELPTPQEIARGFITGNPPFATAARVVEGTMGRFGIAYIPNPKHLAFRIS